MKRLLRVTVRGAIRPPAELRWLDNIEAGEEFEIERRDRGEYILRRKNTPHREALVRLLLACPAKDWFKTLPRIGSIHDTPAARGYGL